MAMVKEVPNLGKEELNRSLSLEIRGLEVILVSNSKIINDVSKYVDGKSI